MMMKDGEIYAKGAVKDVLTRKNIASVYGVNSVVDQHYGKISIVPINRIEQKQRSMLAAC
jgi:ABC-type cobalamin/Fe3+-siderophores transport system ATPase subunit